MDIRSLVGKGGVAVIPDGVTEIPDCALDNCLVLTSIVIRGSVTSIGKTAFNECSGITDLYVYSENPSYVKGILGGMLNKANITLHVPVGTGSAYRRYKLKAVVEE